ncbi:THAP domain-containing protein 2-like [Rhipicephalus microplus]|uniref:THAP domain-containing protein 2-like n=1 Tax=Rhipicephalus microplus TaxID=6941 RepID=UPI003F6C82FC
MVGSCAAFGCANRVKQTPGITFHVFPKDCELRSAWERAVRREGWTSKKNDVLCSTHFEADCFDRTGQTTRLRAGSIPTKFAAFPAHLQKPKARLQAYGAQRRHKAVAASFCPEQYGRRRVSAASLRYMGGYAGPPLQKF